jgi:hypothetical protein
MPVMTDVRSVAANTTIDNILAGKLDEFLRVNSVITLHAIATAAGLRLSLVIGGEVSLDDQEISARAGATAVIVPDDFIVGSAGFNGDRMILRARNTTGAAITLISRTETTPA